ncbi:MAG TPA: single-stranded-DNA-specific exonuclease RecJ [Patescibacteria group bacterium]|nr:single-stranded-DNA-specific exonuclease RecJ [Patescibacteria group bacterium]
MASQLYPKKVWQILNTDEKKDIVDVLLENRNLKTKKEKDDFFDPIKPEDIKLKDLEIDVSEIKKAIKRINLAKKNNEKVFVYGDYDADGVTATAIMWEALHKLKVDAMPYIPDRFIEGYGINKKTLARLKQENENLKVIITVDNGIVAYEAIDAAEKLGIDIIVTDHHEAEKKKNKQVCHPDKAFAIIHTKKICGSAISWIVARELGVTTGLELAGIGTIADQMPLTAANRSFAKYGIEALKKTKRAGLIELLHDAKVEMENISTYEINYIIAPRINAMGRLVHAIEALRLLCVKDPKRAKELAKLISKTNSQRQEIVEKTVVSTQRKMENFNDSIIFLSDKNYHEGVIGLAAGRLVEEFYLPAIVVSRGREFSKGSARSIEGINIIEMIREHAEILVAHGGHTMAAGFTIKTSKIEEFQKRLNKTAKKLLTDEILQRKLKIDSLLDFKLINWELVKKIKQFEPTGNGNPTPSFVTQTVKIIDKRLLGKDKTHLKLKLSKDSKFFDAIGFGIAKDFSNLEKGDLVDVCYNIEENEWNGVKSLQLRIRDLKQV